MSRRHALPSLWLVTDERVGDALMPALARLPRGAGVVFRHFRTSAVARRAVFDKVERAARRRGLVVAVATMPDGHGRWRAAGGGCTLMAAHGVADLIAAWRAGCDLALLSPAFPTRTHAGAPALGPVRFGLAARDARLPVVALGGMTASRARRLAALGAQGWAAIDGLTLISA